MSTRGTAARLRATAAGLVGDGRGWILLTVAFGWFVTIGLRFAVPALLPRIKADFAIDNATAGAAITLIWITYAAMQFPAGVLTDRLGERKLLAASLLLGGVGVTLFAVSVGLGVFLLACAVFGLGTGLYGPARGTVLSKAFEENDGAAFGVVLAVGSIGAAAVPFVASRLVEGLGWRAALGAFVPGFLLVGLGVWIAIPGFEDRDEPDGSIREDLRNAAGAMTELPVVLGGLGALLMVFTFQGLTAFLPTYLVAVKGMAEATATALFTGLFLAGAFFQSVAGTVADRLGHGRVLAFIAAASAAPLLVLPFTSAFPLIAGLVFLLGLRLAIGPVSNAYLIRVLPEEVMGSAWGLLRTVFFVIGSTGSMFVGALADRNLFDESFIALALLTLVATVLYLALPSRDDVA